MAKDPPYHTTSEEYPPEHRKVHHDHNNCEDEKRIKPSIGRAARAANRSAKYVRS
jgi:hypothetical protein